MHPSKLRRRRVALKRVGGSEVIKRPAPKKIFKTCLRHMKRERDVSVGVDVLQGCLPGMLGVDRRRNTRLGVHTNTHTQDVHPLRRIDHATKQGSRELSSASGLPFYTRRQHPTTVSETGGKSKGRHHRKNIFFSGLGRLERLGGGRRGSLQLGLSLDTGLLLGVKLVSWREGYHNRCARAGGGVQVSDEMGLASCGGGGQLGQKVANENRVTEFLYHNPCTGASDLSSQTLVRFESQNFTPPTNAQLPHA